MPGIKHIKNLLDDYPDIKYRATDLNISVPASGDTGFEVNLVVHAEGIRVYYDGWHEEFDEMEEAFRCFIYGLSRFCRLKVTSRGNYRYKWIMEKYENEQWVQDSTTGLFIFPFWRRKKYITLQNQYINDLQKLQEIYNRFSSNHEI